MNKGTQMKAIIALGIALFFSVGALAQTNNYALANIVTSTTDPRLLNPWGLSRPPKNDNKRNEWWAIDQVTGLSTLYSANGNSLGLAVAIPGANGATHGAPAAIANMPSSAGFVFATLDGTISAWTAANPPSKPGTGCYECHQNSALNNSTIGASYRGITVATNATTGAMTYYAANANGRVEAYDATSFAPVTLSPDAFIDASIPTGYSPAGIQAIGSRIFVTFNAIAGGGTGYVDAFDTNGKLLLRLQNGEFDQPWGVVASPSSFGAFPNAILVGNTGSGLIGAYNRTTGAFQGFLQSSGTLLTIPGLWGLGFGDGTPQAGPADVLYFTAGGTSLTTGAFGSITPE
jgi:uncharacterized protein (TIGR03118 family)